MTLLEHPNDIRSSKEAEYIKALYRGVLGREPEEAGFNHWLKIMHSGAMKPHEICEAFFNSVERGKSDLEEVLQSAIYQADKEKKQLESASNPKVECSDKIIDIKNVSKVYPIHNRSRTILKNINLQIRPGQKWGILGRNGSGKSTLIRLISGAEKATSGTIRRGISVSWPLAFSDSFQHNQSGLDCLRFVCRIYGVDLKEKLPFVEDFTELGPHFREPIGTYSSGMRARLAFAVSMAIEFDCFLIDEIVAVGDTRFHKKCEEELFEKRKDRALIIVSHNPGFINEHCDSIAVLIDGRLHVFDYMDEAYAFYQASLIR